MERSAGHAAGVYGREAELARVRRFLDDAHGGPAALLIEGAAGIGKTTLWSAGIDLARRRGWWVLTCRPVQSEAALSFSALGDLLESVPEQALAGLPGPQRRALDVALLRAEPGPEPPDQRAVAVALLGVIRALADTAPVIIGVDDLPWLDRASAAVLEYALRRLTAQRAGLLATIAPGAPGPATPWRQWFAPGRAASLPVGPLSAEALDVMLRAKGGPPDSWPEVVEVHEASGGNPFFAQELAAALGAVGHWRGAGQPLPVPGSLQPLVQRRLAALSPAGRDVALLAAAAANPAVEVVVAACGDDVLARHGLDSAEAAGVLLIAADRVRFTHPLLRSLHYSSATDRERRHAHRRLAEAAGESEGQVRHLALAATGPDEELAGGSPRPPKPPVSAVPRSPPPSLPTWLSASLRQMVRPVPGGSSRLAGSTWPPSTPTGPGSISRRPWNRASPARYGQPRCTSWAGCWVIWRAPPPPFRWDPGRSTRPKTAPCSRL